MQEQEFVQVIDDGALEQASGGRRGRWGRGPWGPWGGGAGWIPMPGPDGNVYEYSADGSTKRRPFNPGTAGPPYFYERRR
jgi:hypothetical protein